MGPPHISQPALRFFRGIVRRYFRRHFRAVRVSEPSRWDHLPCGPILIFANHSSWWDPMVSVLLASRFLPHRRSYAPMDAAALQRYGILRHIGIFAVEMNTARGAAQFLRTGLAILKASDALWVTPQGRFADPRERPLAFKPGLAALASKVPGGCTVLPMAIEYPFWDERLPEALIHFGEPLHINGEPAAEVEQTLKAALLEAMTTLQTKAIARDPQAFTLLATRSRRRRRRLPARPASARSPTPAPLPGRAYRVPPTTPSAGSLRMTLATIAVLCVNLRLDPGDHVRDQPCRLCPAPTPGNATASRRIRPHPRTRRGPRNRRCRRCRPQQPGR